MEEMNQNVVWRKEERENLEREVKSYGRYRKFNITLFRVLERKGEIVIEVLFEQIIVENILELMIGWFLELSSSGNFRQKYRSSGIGVVVGKSLRYLLLFRLELTVVGIQIVIVKVVERGFVCKLSWQYRLYVV